ncbi:MAG: MarR family transcriptional regulator [Planctomycetota bacterium]|nr:MarR family transcriptional regulator [Planctomycetota bacterium]
MSSTLEAPVSQDSASGNTAPTQALMGLLRAASSCEEMIDRVLKREGLSRPQFNVLRVLGEADDKGLPCLEIGARMITRVPDVTRLVDRLVDQGYVCRERSVSDRRVVRVRLLSKGQVVLGRVQPVVDDAVGRTLGHLGEDRLQELTALLDHARSLVEDSRVA